ncbi:hypothetical protein R6Q57_010284 [Mikania cordata]
MRRCLNDTPRFFQIEGLGFKSLPQRKRGLRGVRGFSNGAEKEYQLKSNGQTFNHYHVWVAIKDSPKFRVLCQEGYEVQGSSKRTKNSESNEYSPGGSTAHTNYAVHLENDEEEAEFDTPPEPVRPTGRDTTKRASSSSRQTGSSNPTTTDLADQLQAFTDFQKQKHEDRKKIHEEKSLRADLRAMEALPPKMLDDEDREIMKKMKRSSLTNTVKFYLNF